MRPQRKEFIRSPPDRESEPESSDEDSIPAVVNRTTCSSPSKRLAAVSPSHLNANALKRSYSDSAQGVITLYPASKKQRNKYDMAPDSPKARPVEVTVPTTSFVESPDASSGDDVDEGLVSSVNDAFRQLKTLQAPQNPTEQSQKEASISQKSSGDESLILEDEKSMSQSPGYRLEVLSDSTSEIDIPLLDQETEDTSPPTRDIVTVEDTNRGEVRHEEPHSIGQEHVLDAVTTSPSEQKGPESQKPERQKRSAPTKPTDWTYEEKKILFRYIQDSYPTCPDLNRIRWELNKTFAETAALTEQILDKMLAAVLNELSAEERTARVHRIMRTNVR